MNKKAQIKLIIISIIFALIITVGIAGTFYVSLSSNNDIKMYSGDLSNSDGTISDKLKDKEYIDYIRKHDSNETKNDITKKYISAEKKIIIENSNKEKQLEIKLLTDYNTKVGQGEDIKVAEMLLVDWKSDKMFDDLNFYDITKKYSVKEKEYWFKFGVEYIKEECIDISEKLEDIKPVFVCQNVTRTNWTRFNDIKELKTKNVKIGLFTNTIGEKNVEWIPVINGFDILEFASYEIVGLSSYNNSDGAYSVDGIRALAISPDGNYLVTSSYEDYYVSIMNITNKSEIVTLSTYYDDTGAYSLYRISALAISPDGNYLVTSSYTHSYVSIMNITNKSAIVPLSTFTDNTGPYSVYLISALAISPDGNYLVTSSSNNDYVSIMNITNKASIVPLSTFTDALGAYSVDGIRALAISPDGNYLVTSSYTDSYVSIMNITNKSVIAPLSTFNDAAGEYSVRTISALAISPDGNYLVTSSAYTDSYVSIMNITNKASIVPLSTFNDTDGDYSIQGIRALAISPDGNYLATSSYTDGVVSTMNITNKSVIVPLSTFIEIDDEPYSIYTISALAISPDGNYLATSSINYDYVSIMRFRGEDAVDTTDPIVNLQSPTNETSSTIATHSFDATFTDETQLANSTLYIWNSTGEVNVTTTSISGVSNYTNISVTLPIYDNYTWNYYACDSSNNCAWNLTNWTIEYYYEAEPENCWTEVPGKIAVPPGCKYYINTKEFILPA